MNRLTKNLIITCIIVIGIILFAPVVTKNFTGMEKVDYSASINQINLEIDADATNIQINYASSPTADLISVTWDITLLLSLINTRELNVSFTNVTAGNIVTVTLGVWQTGISLTTISTATVYITINPTIISFLNVTLASGNIILETTNYQNKTFANIDLRTASGNIYADFINGSNLLNNFYLITSSGNIYANFYNMSLNNNDIQGIIHTSSGNLNLQIYQWLDPTGNLTLSCSTSSGNINLVIRLEKDYISSQIAPATSSGNINYGASYPGYTKFGSNLVSTEVGLDSNIDVIINVSSGNINIDAARS